MDKIYLIECYFNGEINYKIGYTRRAPEKRLKELATSNPGELKFYGFSTANMVGRWRVIFIGVLHTKECGMNGSI
jgi:hypothetical protein